MQGLKLISIKTNWHRGHTLKQSSISKIETGMRQLAVEDILYLSYALDKPIRYFFPKEFTEEQGGEDLKILEEELLLQARRLTPMI